MDMHVSFLILISVLGVSLASLSGVFLLLLNHRFLERILPALVSFSTGALLGDVFLHMLPEMTEEGASSRSWLIVLGGILASFILEKFIHWHHCHVVECEEHHHPLGVMNLVGDFLHNAIDGVLIAGSFLVSVELGIATTVAVLFHEIPQEIGDVGILLYSGYSRWRTVLFNLGTALSAVIGAVIVIGLQTSSAGVAAFLLPFAAGNFLYIAGSDLIPELHKETAPERSLIQLIGIVIGIGVMALLLFME
jgi:zinc and cadmium transporter